MVLMEIRMLHGFLEIFEVVTLNWDVVDSLYWKTTSTGIYVVKDTYRVLVTTNNLVDEFFYKEIWKLPIPHNVTAFTWRLSKDRLPCQENL